MEIRDGGINILDQSIENIVFAELDRVLSLELYKKFEEISASKGDPDKIRKIIKEILKSTVVQKEFNYLKNSVK